MPVWEYEIGLDEIFKPLHNEQTNIIPLKKSKVQKYWLRIYALRIESNIYIVTGGAIKLTKTMQERQHTQKELNNIDRCKNFLVEQGIVDHDGLIETLQSQ
ncbi:hypothetical protein K4L44_04050 [Halosquirtibacter laminarini]|uniref:Uncharacterized protein n=1 Tax=Halosquirtibacter laminarini TaxID=3374600 RepID=A0AC61NR74_9BACT|nr:hypothetical protein K4L44_04050 [Prolixibacteraceae bacterium]